MKIISWNVNGFRSVIKKKALNQIEDADVICFQETRCPEASFLEESNQISEQFAYKTISISDKKGYVGVGVYSKIPFSVLKVPEELGTGRVNALDFGSFILFNVYVPNSKPDLSALEMRSTIWEPSLRSFVSSFKTTKKTIIMVGDFNVAPTDNDIYMKKPSSAHGATPIEREGFQKLLAECKLSDTYRALHGDGRQNEWTWFSNFGNARKHGHGWRIDMALISSSKVAKYVESSEILSSIVGSDHIPISLLIVKK
jgi:exodeoxyribonuclease-3